VNKNIYEIYSRTNRNFLTS